MSGFARTHGRVERTPEKSSARPMAKKNEPRRRAVDLRMEETRLPFEFDQLLVERSPEARMQPKLKVHGSDDLWEREADANADSVLRALGGQTESAELRLTPLVVGAAADATSGPVQRQEEEEEEELLQAKRVGGGARKLGAAAGVQIRALRGGGRPLPATLRSEFEAQFGCDFGRVRIHAESNAAEVAARIGARAFTTGQDVVFANGEYRPEDREGQRLLAHELTHVVQQTRPGSSPPGGDAIQRKRAAVPATPRKALDTALKGDDDDVRELTQSKVWPGLDVKSRESATLMEHLLDGATLDEDEQAGIKVLTKAQQQNRVDDALEEIDSRGRFSQLLDDYHGAEYRELLKLLSTAIKRRKVKALYLDAFIAMWWLNKSEEEAVVVLLEKSAVADVAALLKEKNRSGELRSDIDDEALSKRFEKRAEVGVVLTFDELSKKLNAIFKVKAKRAIGTKTPAGVELRNADVKRLLKAAGEELTAILLDYKKRLNKAVKAGDTDRVRKLNGNFEARVKHMLERKKLEFDKELVFNFEFNRHLEGSYGRDWTVDDLKRIDTMLRKIPPEILYANPDFKGIERGRTHPSKRGHADPNTNFIALFGNLKKLDTGGTLPHEVGHIAHFGAKTEFTDFKKISDWQPLTRADLTALAKTEGIPEDIDDPLDQHRIKGSDYSYVSHGKYNYRWARYKSTAGHYWRYLENADFVTRYAETDPQEDFAETFELYLTDPEEAQDEAPKKYDFIHLRIFVRYWLEQQKKRVAKELGDLIGVRSKKIKNRDLGKFVRNHGWSPVLKSLRKAFDRLKERKTTAVVGGWLTEPVPLKGSPRATRIKREHWRRIENICRLGEVIDRRLARFGTDSRVMELLAPTGMEAGFGKLAGGLIPRFRKDLQKLLRPKMAQVMKGKVVLADPWPEFDALARRYDGALLLIDSYLPYHSRCKKIRSAWRLGVEPFYSSDAYKKMDRFALKMLKRLRKAPHEQRLLKDAIVDARMDLLIDFDDQQEKLLELVGQGKRYRRGRLVEPKVLVSKYRSKVRRRYRRIRQGKPAIKAKGMKPQWY